MKNRVETFDRRSQRRLRWFIVSPPSFFCSFRRNYAKFPFRAPTLRHCRLNCDKRERQRKRERRKGGKKRGLITKWNSKVQRRTRLALIVFIQLRNALRRPRTSFHYFKSDVVLLPATYRTVASPSDRLYRCHFPCRLIPVMRNSEEKARKGESSRGLLLAVFARAFHSRRVFHGVARYRFEFDRSRVARRSQTPKELHLKL